MNNTISLDARDKIKAIILKLLMDNNGYAKREFSSSELQRLSRQMTNSTQINQDEIIGLYDGSIANSFSGNFSGILFFKDRIYVNLSKATSSLCMRYEDMTSITGDPSAFFANFKITSKNADQIVLKGLSYTTPKVFAVFVDIIKIVEDDKKANGKKTSTKESNVQNEQKTISSSLTNKSGSQVATVTGETRQTSKSNGSVCENQETIELQFFQKELPSFVQSLKKNLHIDLHWKWNFIGDSDFNSIMYSVRNGRVQHRNDEIPVAFYDETLLGNKKSGILITTKRIYHITAFQNNIFALTDSESVCSFRGTIGEDEPYCRIKWCSAVSNVDISGESPSKAHNVLLFWGNLFKFLITKEITDIITTTQTGNNVKIFSLIVGSSTKVSSTLELTSLQKNMLSLLLRNSFSDYDKKQKPRLDEWGNIKENIIACEKYSLLTWSDYAFYTNTTLYYHCKKQKTHTLIRYSEIKSYDIDTCVLEYGNNGAKINISLWDGNVRNFVKQLYSISKIEDENDTRILEFCFNRCSDFRNNLRYFKIGEITSAFKKQCQQQHAPELLRENFEHISITKMDKGNIELQFWSYFPRVETITINEDDSEYDIHEKELEQERLYDEAEERVELAQSVAAELPNIKEDIIKLFQMAIYNLYGVLFDEKNITFLEEPDFTFEGPTLAERVQSKIAPVKSVVDSMMESTARQMADIERKYNKDK